MRIPFRQLVNETFQKEGSLWAKMLGAAFVCSFVVVWGTLKYFRSNHFPIDQKAITFLVVGGIVGLPIGALLAFILSFKDTIEQKLARGDQVHPIIKTLFGMGSVSLLIWFCLAIPLTFVITIASLLIKIR